MKPASLSSSVTLLGPLISALLASSLLGSDNGVLDRVRETTKLEEGRRACFFQFAPFPVSPGQWLTISNNRFKEQQLAPACNFFSLPSSNQRYDENT